MISLPTDRLLRLSLDPRASEFGDTFLNGPAMLGQRPPAGRTHLTGWVAVAFDEPVDGRARFTLDYHAVGTDEELLWGGGQQFSMLRNRLLPMEFQPGGAEGWTGGVLDLDSGDVEPESIRVSAAFQNSVIAAVGALNRLPFLFPFVYPMPKLDDARQLGDDQGPLGMWPEHCEIDFSHDDRGEITGLALRGETNVPVCLFPDAGLFPPFSFGAESRFYFSHPTGCLEGTPSWVSPGLDDAPDGVHLPRPAYFHPHLSLVSESVQTQTAAEPAAVPAPTGRDRAATAVCDGAIYAIGGYEDEQVSPRVAAYHPAAGTWEMLDDLPCGVAAAAAYSHGTEIFVLGGRRASGEVTASVQILDTRTGRWRLGESLPVAVAGAAAAAIGERGFLAGGWTGSDDREISDLLQIYDHRTGTWKLGERMLLPVAEAAAAVCEDRLHVINGRVDADTVTARVSIYSPAEERWGVGSPTCVGVCQASVADLGRRLLLVGGRTRAEGATEARAQQFEVSTGRWQLGLEPFVGSAGGFAAGVGGEVVSGWGRVQAGDDAFPGRIGHLIQVFSPYAGWRTVGRQPAIGSADVFNAGAGVLSPRELSPGARAMVLTGPSPQRQLGGLGGLEDVDVLIDGRQAPVLSCCEHRLEFLVPDLPTPDEGSRPAAIEFALRKPEVETVTASVRVARAAPNLFVLSFAAFAKLASLATREPEYLRGASALAANADGTLNCPRHPEAPAALVRVAATGLGVRGNDTAGVTATIGGRRVEVEGLEQLPGYPGVTLVALRTPDHPRADATLHRLVLSVGTTASNPVTVSVQQGAERTGAMSFGDGVLTVLGDPSPMNPPAWDESARVTPA